MADWDNSRVWFDLQRMEERLRWPSNPGSGPQYDSMGRLAHSSVMNWGREQMGRVRRLRDALENSGPLAKSLITQTLAGISLADIWDILVSACKDVAIYYCGTLAAGGAVGATLGGIFGVGAGALPGAAAGAAAGSYVGGVILGILGLKAILEESSLALPEVLIHYQRGFVEAWGPDRQDAQHGVTSSSRGDSYVAAGSFANGHVLLITAMLAGLLAYITRGRGDKTAMLSELGRSRRLGPKVASWVQANEDRLRRHPALQSRRRSSTGVEPAPPPKRKPDPDDNQNPKAKRMPRANVPCFEPNDLPKEKLPEFDRQLAGQEAGLNNMTVEEYVKGRDAFDSKRTVRDPNIARQERTKYERELKRGLMSKYAAEGLSTREADDRAKTEVRQIMSTLAALHNPDMVAAGKDAIAGFGDRNVNCRIGAQWTKRLIALDKMISGIPESERASLKMNAKLDRCNKGQ